MWYQYLLLQALKNNVAFDCTIGPLIMLSESRWSECLLNKSAFAIRTFLYCYHFCDHFPNFVKFFFFIQSPKILQTIKANDKSPKDSLFCSCAGILMVMWLVVISRSFERVVGVGIVKSFEFSQQTSLLECLVEFILSCVQLHLRLYLQTKVKHFRNEKTNRKKT